MSHSDYSPAVWRYFNAAEQAGAWPAATDVLIARAQTPGSRAVMQLQARVRDDRIEDARFKVYGCVSAIACGAWLAGWLPGKNREQVAQLKAADIISALELAPVKRHCALLAEDAAGLILQKWSPNPQSMGISSNLEATG